mmetsp:Transcript_71000/g.170091  ORF Transcript_71000/g.170091 Transcript_71000/m.170091 type:complete len:250 (-) Transcript_71000:330-1079(-)
MPLVVSLSACQGWHGDLATWVSLAFREPGLLAPASLGHWGQPWRRDSFSSNGNASSVRQNPELAGDVEVRRNEDKDDILRGGDIYKAVPAGSSRGWIHRSSPRGIGCRRCRSSEITTTSPEPTFRGSCNCMGFIIEASSRGLINGGSAQLLGARWQAGQNRIHSAHMPATDAEPMPKTTSAESGAHVDTAAAHSWTPSYTTTTPGADAPSSASLGGSCAILTTRSVSGQPLGAACFHVSASATASNCPL